MWRRERSNVALLANKQTLRPRRRYVCSTPSSGRGRHPRRMSHVDPKLCENYFLETEATYCVMNLASAAIMNRPRCLLGSIVAQKDSASAFSHSLDSKRTCERRGSPPWGVNHQRFAYPLATGMTFHPLESFGKISIESKFVSTSTNAISCFLDSTRYRNAV